ncbi:MAG: ABC transporter ATP-binding protein [Inconstantimicrobium porci]|uniref:ABC transporter ATP-binding protein n=1 Tax=Inconstantimicrobium porci TaxID=2652291 RepID=UPI002A91807D|nr:ABC transporter ATP-binding protein [Inconstantimicrobium porci]MDY5912677.1 ABC transporter ATP-binding protein [Inconstantimicrobium porci]
MEEVVKFNNINKSYGDSKIYDNFNIDIRKGRINSILGKSGCGKTTLLKVIAGDSRFKGHISYIFQEDRLIPWKNIYKNMEFVLEKKYTRDDRKNIINKYLSMLNISECSNKYPSELSGGMRQRADIGRAFAYPGEILLMDEPFKSLDIKTKEDIINDFKQMTIKEKRTVILVTHDIDEALKVSDYIFVFGKRPVEILQQYDLYDSNKEIIAIKQEVKELFGIYKA